MRRVLSAIAPITLAAWMLVSGVAVSGSVTVAAAQAQNAAEAGTFVTRMARTALDDLTLPSIPEAQRTKRFQELMDEAFDVPLISRFVLGRYWRQATEAERTEYTRLFRELIVQSYARRFTDFSGAQFRVTSTSPPNEDGDVMVAVEGIIPAKPPVRLDVRVRQVHSAQKVIDVAIEGVSMAMTQRDEFASVIQRGGGNLEALLASLRERVGQR